MNSTITIVGNLVAEPELKEVNGTPLAKLRVATNERVKKDGEWTDGASTFIDVSAWRKLANAANSLSKGSPVIITGKLKGRSFEYADGRKGYAYEIDAEAIGKNLTFNEIPDVVKTKVTADTDAWDE